MRGKKDIRVVFHENPCYCPDCSFNGNFTQVKLHLRITHRYADKLVKQHMNECCTLCKKEFTTRLEVKKHMLAAHN